MNEMKRLRVYGVSASENKQGVCYYCRCSIDEYSQTVDHLIPRSRGGNLSNKNKVWACFDCNSLKGQMTPEEFKEALYMAIRQIRATSNKQINHMRRIIQSIDRLIDERKEKDIKKDRPALPQ